jgi:hypothetical protein
MERVAHLQSLPLHIKFLIKIPLVKEIFPFSHRPMFSKNGALMETDALFMISFGVHSKGALPPGFPQRAPSEKDAPFPEPSIQLSKSQVNDSPSKFPSRATMGR